MSWIGIIFVSVFSANALLSYGLGGCQVMRGPVRGSLAVFLSNGIATILVSCLLWCARTLLLDPLGLSRLDVLVFAVLIAPLIKYLASLGATANSSKDNSIFSLVDDTTLSCLVFGIALLIVRRNFTLLEALVASVFSILGYSAAVALLEAIRKRLELSQLPRHFKGSPAILLSAGLMAMAFSGLDGHFIARLVK